jgi:hypothetical protein
LAAQRDLLESAEGAAREFASLGGPAIAEATSSTDVGVTDNNPKTVCGPNVKKQVMDAQLKTRSKFYSWSNPRKEEACQDLVSIFWGPIAWDIIQLNEQSWIRNVYGPACATKATPDCTTAIQVDGDCHYAGSVNYVHFGNAFDLCQRYYAVAFPLNRQFTETEMFKWIDLYKGKGIFFGPSANFKSSVDWAMAGFYNWPSGAATPPGDRPNCSPTCPKPYVGGAFDVNWSGENF